MSTDSSADAVLDEPDPGTAPTLPAAAAATTASGLALSNPWSQTAQASDTLLADAAATDAWAQLSRCFPNWPYARSNMRTSALKRLAANRPVDPNDRLTWQSADAHVTSVLRRHGLHIKAKDLADRAAWALVDGQRKADEDAGLDWLTLHDPARLIDQPLAEANRVLPIDLGDPAVWWHPEAQRTVLARRLGIDVGVAEELSHWALANASSFEADTLRSWRIASPTWLRLADEQLGPVGTVDRPVGVFIAPSSNAKGWCLRPVLSLPMIRLIAELGGGIDRTLQIATIPGDVATQLLRRMNTNTLHSGDRAIAEQSTEIARLLGEIFGQTVRVSLTRDTRDRWGRLHVSEYSRAKAGSQIQLVLMTTTVKDFSVKRLGAARLNHQNSTSVVMELGEAVNCAVDRGLPLLLSSEAAGTLNGTVRVGRMRGRPGMVTITSSDGVEAKTSRLMAEQAVLPLRELRDSGAEVILDAGALQVMRMVLAKPLSDDPVLLGRQCDVAAKMTVGSGVQASQTGTGKTVVSARGAIYHRAAAARRRAKTEQKPVRWRAVVVAEGRLLGQWLSELTVGAPSRGMPPLAPNVQITTVNDRSSVAGQVRAFHRACGDEPGVLLVPDSVLDRYPDDLMVIRWHMLIADEALRYANTATEAHKALRKVRIGAVADCWLLSATPRGKSREHLDVLVGLAVGDESMIEQRLATREAGDLLDEINAHRLRECYGPHLVRITRSDMQQWMPKVRKAEAIVVEADDALLELLDAIRKGGQEAYRALLQVLQQLKALEKGSELHKAALVELSRAQAVVLGNVGCYVDASVDPGTLKHSASALAQALTRQGLVDAAMRGGGDGQPTLRGIVAKAVAETSADDQVIVFADRVRCLHQLAGLLTDRHGVQAHVADGKISPDEFDELKRAFVAGEFPVLCVSKVGQQGHNLQNAGSLVHLDLPWVPTGLEQRVGRAARPGSRRSYVQSFIPYIRGGGVEHIVKILAERGGEHHQVLDSYEGVAVSDSTIATQLAEITAQVADSKQAAGYASTAARLRVAGAVFGA